MELKTIKAKITHTSRLGTLEFRGVPIMVAMDQKARSFDPHKDDYYLSGDVIKILDREIAKQWLKSYGNESKARRLTAEEAIGIMSVLGINASQFARLIGVNKSKVSKALNGSQKFELPTSRLAAMILGADLRNPGSVALSIVESGGFIDEPMPPVSNFARLA